MIVYVTLLQELEQEGNKLIKERDDKVSKYGAEGKRIVAILEKKEKTDFQQYQKSEFNKRTAAIEDERKKKAEEEEIERQRLIREEINKASAEAARVKAEEEQKKAAEARFIAPTVEKAAQLMEDAKSQKELWDKKIKDFEEQKEKMVEEAIKDAVVQEEKAKKKQMSPWVPKDQLAGKSWAEVA